MQKPTLIEHKSQCSNYYQEAKHSNLHYYFYSANLQHANVLKLNICLFFSSCLQKFLILQQEFLAFVKQWWFSHSDQWDCFMRFLHTIPFVVPYSKVKTAKVCLTGDSISSIRTDMWRLCKMAVWVPILTLGLSYCCLLLVQITGPPKTLCSHFEK